MSHYLEMFDGYKMIMQRHEGWVACIWLKAFSQAETDYKTCKKNSVNHKSAKEFLKTFNKIK